MSEELPYKEFRADGWPLCPKCGEDELFSVLLLNWKGDTPRPTVEQCLADRMCCYRCMWSNEDVDIRGLRELMRTLGRERERRIDERAMAYTRSLEEIAHKIRFAKEAAAEFIEKEKWLFKDPKRYWLEIMSLAGNFLAREQPHIHPYSGDRLFQETFVAELVGRWFKSGDIE